MLVSIEVKVLVLLSVEIEVLVLVSVEIEVLVVVSVEIEVLSNGSLWFGFGSLGWLWKIVVRSHKSINNKRSTTALEPGTASSMVVSPELLAPPPNRVLQAAGYQRMLAPNHPQLRNRVLQAVGISHWFVHKGEDRVPLPLWHIIQTSGIDELVDQGLVEPLVFLELAFPTRAQDVPKLLGFEVRDLLP